MAGIGEGFMQGLALGQQRRERKKDREMEQARLTLEAKRHEELMGAQKALQADKLDRDAKQAELDRSFRRELTDKELAMRATALDKTLTAEGARDAARLKARGDEAAMDRIGRSIDGFSKFAAAQKPPTGRVKRPMDPNDPAAGEVTYDVPVDQIQQPKPAADPYQSPYAKDIADAETQLAEQNSQMAEGDTRGGFMGLQSRSGLAGEQKMRLVNLKARELEDKVAKGILSQEQAEAEAQRLKSAYGF